MEAKLLLIIKKHAQSYMQEIHKHLRMYLNLFVTHTERSFQIFRTPASYLRGPVLKSRSKFDHSGSVYHGTPLVTLLKF